MIKVKKNLLFPIKKLKRIGNALGVVKRQISRRSAEQIGNALGVAKRQIWRQSAEIAGLLQINCNAIRYPLLQIGISPMYTFLKIL